MRSIIQWSALLGSAVLAFACGGSSSGNFNGQQGDGDDGGDTASSSSGGTATGSSGGSSSGSTGNSSFSVSSSGGMGNGTCKTGEYAGTFSCYFFQVFDAGLNDMPDSGGIGPVTGTMSFALTQNQTAGVGEGTGTDLAMGTFAASLSGIVQADADLQGTLDCGQGSFMGNLINGVYGLGNGMGDAGPVSGGGASNTFMGPLQSGYDGTTAEFVNGRWSMTIPTLGECIGSWSATYSGPLSGSSGGSSGSPADAGAD
jgi:hypothetical protein